jgi:thiol:disulfide interchange protein DsbD
MLQILGASLLGGLILNVMPCVLPVLTLKAFTVVEHSKHHPTVRRMHGVAYTAGTVSLFLAIAGVVAVLKSSGRHLGWGMQFQYPPFVATLTALVFVFALNAIGLFEVLVSAQGGEGKDDKLWGSLVNGWFAAIMSTPCSAPFLGTAVAFALLETTTAVQTFLIFGTMGFGLALPYLALTFIPGLGERLPRPGAWMERVKQVMGFALLGTTIWLFGTFQRQVTPEASNWFLFFLLTIAFALWLAHNFGSIQHSAARRWIVRITATAGVVFAARAMVSFEKESVVSDGHIAWTPYSASVVAGAHARKRPIFLDFTAEWCASCKVNDKAILETDTVRKALKRTQILPVKVDMTNDNDEFDRLLDKFYKGMNRNGIPAYVVYFPDGTFDLLPVVITAEMVQISLDAAAKKYPADKS